MESASADDVRARGSPKGLVLAPLQAQAQHYPKGEGWKRSQFGSRKRSQTDRQTDAPTTTTLIASGPPLRGDPYFVCISTTLLRNKSHFCTARVRHSRGEIGEHPFSYYVFCVPESALLHGTSTALEVVHVHVLVVLDDHFSIARCRRVRPLYTVHVYRQETDFFKGLSCVLLTVLGVLSSTERSWTVPGIPRECSKRCVFGSCCPRAGKAFYLLETNILAVHSREREKERDERFEVGRQL